jgi:hypothetical protein
VMFVGDVFDRHYELIGIIQIEFRVARK